MVRPSAPATGAEIEVPQGELDAAMPELTGELGKAMEEMGEVLVEGVTEGMEQMGDMLGGLMGALAEMAPRLQRLETEYDLDSAEGIQAAAPDLAARVVFATAPRCSAPSVPRASARWRRRTRGACASPCTATRR